MSMRIATTCLQQKAFVRLFSTEAVPKPKLPEALRTSADPLSQDEQHNNRFYTIPPKVCNEFFALNGFPNTFRKNINVFGEAAVLIRPHSTELIGYLKNADYTRPAQRYVLYGKPGTGKSVTLSHMLHYAYLANFAVVHVPWVWSWYKRDRIEVTNSDTKEGLYNLPVEASTWLKYFQKQNEHILSNPDYRLSKEYVWSPRETTPADSPLKELVTHGIGRIRYACDVIEALIYELKLLSAQRRCKLLISIDGFNQFLLPFSNLKNAEKRRLVPDEVTLAQTFLSAVKADWTNGAVIVTVDQLNTREKNASEKPMYLLKKRGFELLDPFIPIQVPELSHEEFHNMLDFYEEKRWLQKSGARDELEFISARNPYTLLNLCASL